MDYDKFFNLKATEVRIHNGCSRPENSIDDTLWNNLWCEEFLPGWSDFKQKAYNYRLQNRESVIVEKQTRYFYDLPQELKIDSEEFLHGDYDLVKRNHNLFAIYSPRLPRKIIYYEDYYIAREEIKQIVRIHERMHAYQHVNIALFWEDFSDISPVYLEFLAQIFTYKCVEGTHLERYFRELSKSQPSIYQTWILAQNFPNIEVEDIYKEIWKKGYTDLSQLKMYADKYDKISFQQRAYTDTQKNGDEPELAKQSQIFLDNEVTMLKKIDELNNSNYKIDSNFQSEKIQIVMENKLQNLW